MKTLRDLVLIVVAGFFVASPSLVRYFNSNIENQLESLPSMVQAIASIFNLLIIIWIFHSNRTQKQAETKNSINVFWFSKLLLDRHLDEISNYFAGLEGSMSNLCKSDEVSESDIAEKLKEFDDMRRRIYYSSNSLLELIDATIATDFQSKVDQAYDVYSETIGSPADLSDHENPAQRIASIRRGAFRLLYNKHLAVIE